MTSTTCGSQRKLSHPQIRGNRYNFIDHNYWRSTRIFSHLLELLLENSSRAFRIVLACKQGLWRASSSDSLPSSFFISFLSSLFMSSLSLRKFPFVERPLNSRFKSFQVFTQPRCSHSTIQAAGPRALGRVQFSQ